MTRLVVVVPGLNGFKHWNDLLTRLAKEPALDDSQWMRWDHRRRWYRLGRPESLARDLRARIDQEWAARGPFDDVVLVGHSSGGLLVRQAYLLGAGVDYPAREPSAWVRRVSRIVLFAAINRGVDSERNAAIRLGRWIGRVCPPVRCLFVWQLLRGSEFVTNLRVEWIRHFAQLGDHAPVVVQLLGTRDRLVHREDSVDLEQFPTAYYIEIPEATHADLYRLGTASDPEGRYALLRDAFVHDRPTVAENIRINGPDKVIFVLHGIRANNKTWVNETRDVIRVRWPDIQAIGPGYDYMSALHFAIPLIRRRYLSWFQDAYTEALARNPQATFNFIGHSNGTYLLGESLKAIPGMRFERVVLIGSVLPTDYAWDERIRRGQVKTVRIDGSRYDWPVGWLCSALRGLGMRDVGTGGFDGFSNFVAGEAKQEFLWYAGGHSAPLVAGNLEALAEYAVTGAVIAPKDLLQSAQWFSMLSRALRILAPLAVALAVVAFAFLLVSNPLMAIALALLAVIVVFLLDIF